MSGSNRSAMLYEKVGKVLGELEMEYTPDGEDKSFRFSMGIKSKIRRIAFKIAVFDDAILVCAVSPAAAPYRDKKRMREATEMICRINYGLRGGSFDLDVRDGTLLFRCWLGCEGADPSDVMIRNAVGGAVAMFDRYGDAVFDVFRGAAPAREAVLRAERAAKGAGCPGAEDDGVGDGD